MGVVCRAVFLPDGRVIQIERKDYIFNVHVVDRFDVLKESMTFFSRIEANKRVASVSDRR